MNLLNQLLCAIFGHRLRLMPGNGSFCGDPDAVLCECKRCGNPAYGSVD